MKRFKLTADTFLLALCLFFSSVLMGFSGGGFILNIQELGFSVSSGLGAAIHSAGTFVTDSITAVAELSELKKKYDALSKELEQYEILQRSNADIKRENEELRSLIGFSQQIAIKNIAAEIIGFDANSEYNGIIINKGSRTGIKKNMPVIAFQDGSIGLVGKIIKVGQFTSMLLPLYDYQFFVAGKTEQTQFQGIVQGQGDEELALLMKYVKKSAKNTIQIGDKILSSGFDADSLFPKNIPIGFVTQIKNYTYKTSLELDIEPVLDFARLNYVFVLDTHTRKGDAK